VVRRRRDVTVGILEGMEAAALSMEHRQSSKNLRQFDSSPLH
jgi:hypothetical protein